MKYMLIMRATDEAMERVANTDFAEMLDTMGRFNDELIRAGVLLAAEGLDPDPAAGVVVDFTSEAPVVGSVRVPFASTGPSMHACWSRSTRLSTRPFSRITSCPTERPRCSFRNNAWPRTATWTCRCRT